MRPLLLLAVLFFTPSAQAEDAKLKAFVDRLNHAPAGFYEHHEGVARASRIAEAAARTSDALNPLRPRLQAIAENKTLDTAAKLPLIGRPFAIAREAVRASVSVSGAMESVVSLDRNRVAPLRRAVLEAETMRRTRDPAQVGRTVEALEGAERATEPLVDGCHGQARRIQGFCDTVDRIGGLLTGRASSSTSRLRNVAQNLDGIGNATDGYRAFLSKAARDGRAALGTIAMEGHPTQDEPAIKRVSPHTVRSEPQRNTSAGINRHPIAKGLPKTKKVPFAKHAVQSSAGDGGAVATADPPSKVPWIFFGASAALCVGAVAMYIRRRPPVTAPAPVIVGELQGDDGRVLVRSFALAAGRRAISIGRQGGNDLVLADVEVSAVHASIEPEQGVARLVDARSTNGTFVNGDRITSVRLRDGDQIRIGKSIVLYRQHNGSANPL